MAMMCSVAVAIAMAMMVMSGSVMQGAEAQSISCLTVDGQYADVADANSLVQYLRQTPEGSCCQRNNECTVVITDGNAEASICGPHDKCLNCVDMGNALNLVLANCVTTNGVQGAFYSDIADQYFLSLTANTSS